MLKVGGHDSPTASQVAINSVPQDIPESLSDIGSLSVLRLWVDRVAAGRKGLHFMSQPKRIENFLGQDVMLQAIPPRLLYGVKKSRSHKAYFYEVIKVTGLERGILPVVGKAEKLPGNRAQFVFLPQMPYSGH